VHLQLSPGIVAFAATANLRTYPVTAGNYVSPLVRTAPGARRDDRSSAAGRTA